MTPAALLHPPDTSDEPTVVCATCATGYKVRLTLGECPVCGTPADHVEGVKIPRRIDSETRTTALVVGAMVANLLILAVLAVLYLSS